MSKEETYFSAHIDVHLGQNHITKHITMFNHLYSNQNITILVYLIVVKIQDGVEC